MNAAGEAGRAKARRARRRAIARRPMRDAQTTMMFKEAEA